MLELQYWTVGLTNTFHLSEVLFSLINQRANDPRAVLNELQLGILGQTDEESSDDKSNNTDFRKRARALAALDSALGKLDGDTVSLLAKKMPNLDFAGGEFVRSNDSEERLGLLRDVRHAMWSDAQMERFFSEEWIILMLHFKCSRAARACGSGGRNSDGLHSLHGPHPFAGRDQPGHSALFAGQAQQLAGQLQQHPDAPVPPGAAPSIRDCGHPTRQHQD